LTPILGTIASTISGNLAFPSMEYIATYEVPSTTVSQIDFNGISQEYTHLHIRGVARNSHPVYNDGGLYWQQNGVGQGQYHNYYILPTGSPSLSSGGAGGAGTPFGVVPTATVQAGYYAQWVLDMFDYKNTNKNKTVIFRSGYAGGSGVNAFAMGSASFANNTNATTSMRFYSLTSNFTQYTKFTLYGIKG
jgi:hypothetical protein